MCKQRIDQVLAGFAEGDAISHEALQLRGIFRKLGYESELFVDPSHVAPAVQAECRPLSELPRSGTTNRLFYHYSIASPASDAFLAAEGGKGLIYHNITPSHYFKGFSDAVEASLVKAREQLAGTAARCDMLWAASRFDAEELEHVGMSNVQVLELPFSPTPQNLQPDPRIIQRFSTGDLCNILFVGRMAPNKRIEDLILSFAWYNQTIDPFSRLVLVGSPRSSPKYYLMLRMLANELNLANVCFEGYASPEGLVAYYETADVFVCASEHEGYCLPLVEAMSRGIPVIARRAGGTPEAMGGAGLLYEDLSHAELAELIHRALFDYRLRDEMLVQQEQRVERALARNLEAEVRTLLQMPSTGCHP
jgi:glycosyltransferase involved in cell wall biosynthesis